MRERGGADLPPGRPPLINRWTVPTGFPTRFVSVVTTEERFGRATRRYYRVPNIGHRMLYAGVLDVPFAHLTEKEQFIIFAQRPRHVENVGLYVAGKEAPHIGFGMLMEMIAAGKFVGISR
jgi:hypothetical protein